MTVNISKVALILKILRTVSYPYRNYWASNLLFRSRNCCMGQLNKTQTEIPVMLTLSVLESYTKMKTLLKFSRISADPTWNGGSLKFLWNFKEMLFYLLIFFNIISFTVNCHWFKAYRNYSNLTRLLINAHRPFLAKIAIYFPLILLTCAKFLVIYFPLIINAQPNLR